MPDQTPDNKSVIEPKCARHVSTALALWRRWQAWIIGPLLIGLIGVLLTWGCDYASYLNRRLLEHFPQSPIIVLPFGFAFIVYLVRRFFRGGQGDGIPQTLATLNDADPRKKHHLLSIRILIGKFVTVMGGLAVGASIGRDGPMVQIGASIMHLFYGKGQETTAPQRRMLIMAGGAAGIAAAFSAPLAAIVFAFEALSGKQVFRNRSLLVLAVILCALVSLSLLGQNTYFGATTAFLYGLENAPAVILCGLVGGLVGGIFSRLMIKMSFNPPRMLAGLVWNRPLLFAAFCGVGVALLGILTDNLVFGSGDEATRTMLHAGGSSFVWYYGLAKMTAVFLSAISGIPGGLIAPSLAAGAGLGDSLSQLFPSLAPHGAMVLMVMAAYLSGVTRAPLTALVLTVETTSGLHLLLPLLVVVLIASAVSKLINPQPLYQTLTERFTH